MNSRYDFMTESKILDPEDQQTYPDVSSCNYVGGQLTKIPTSHLVSENDIKKWWKFFYDNYGVTYYDDIFMNINGIPYEGMLEIGSELLKIDFNDITGWISNKSRETPE